MRELESLFLRIARPRGNKVKGNLRKAENLRSKFRRDIHQHQFLERQELLGLPASTGKSTRKAIKDKSLPVLAVFAKTGLRLRTKFKGKYLQARVLKSGVILFEGKRFNSPSMAAAAACNRPSCNGWTFWRYERGPHEWVILDKLRKGYGK